MDDMLFYQNYFVSADLVAMILCVTMWFILKSSYTVKKRNLNLFIWCDVLIFIAAFSGIVLNDLMNDISAQNVTLIYIFRAIVYSAPIVTYSLYCMYFINIIGMKESVRKRLAIAMLVFDAVYICAEFLGPMFEFNFYIDSELMVHENYEGDIFRVAYLSYTFLLAGILIANRKKFITRMYACIRAALFLSLGIMVFESLYDTSAYTCIAFLIPLMAILYLFHNNSYDLETGTLDIRAFKSYIRNLKNKKYAFIWLYIKDMNRAKIEELSEEFLHFNEKYFNHPITFRVKDDKLVLIYRKDKNPDADKIKKKILADFMDLYEIHQLDFKLMLNDSSEYIRDGDGYLALNQEIEEKMNINTIYICNDDDINGFVMNRYIFRQLKDIAENGSLDDDRIKVYCQPVYDTTKQCFTTAEALMRMELPECGMVFPDQFIPLAEKYDYIHILSLIILNKTCRELKKMENEGYQYERVSVNFSIQELRIKSFCEDIISIIEKNEISFDKIAIELTESRNERDFENVKTLMNRMHKLGIKFYLDDFGTGYSNFERIIGLPIDIIKFDRSLTILSGKDDSSKSLVGSFSNIFVNSQYQILFEGVEDDNDENRCREMRANYLQGYKYSKPIPIERLRDFFGKK